MQLKFRNLKADEIECRAQRITERGLSLLLYKDARVDQNILDETVGPMNWQRHHSRDNANCIISIWDEDKKQWVEKEDTGTESNTEAEKGLASDSFKRAAFNWGVGRELYTAPFIWIPADKCKIETERNRYKCNEKFAVSDIQIEDGKIVALSISNSKGVEVYTMGKRTAKTSSPKQADVINEDERKAIMQAICDGFADKDSRNNVYFKMLNEMGVKDIKSLPKDKVEDAISYIRQAV